MNGPGWGCRTASGRRKHPHVTERTIERDPPAFGKRPPKRT